MVNSQGKAITVNPDSLAHSVHKDLGCVDCHAGAAKSGHTAKTASASCLTCHADEAAKLSASAHAMLGDPKDSSTCIACHGTHDVVNPATRGRAVLRHLPRYGSESIQLEHSRPGARQNERRRADLPELPRPGAPGGGGQRREIAGEQSEPARHLRPVPFQPGAGGQIHVRRWPSRWKPTSQSVHGRAIQQGNLNAASCNDCHGVHDILPASDPHSKIWKQNVASTCAQCHKNVFDTYRQSIHGQAVAAGVLDAATCTDCHGEHRILAPGNPQSLGLLWPMFRRSPARAATPTPS